MIECFFCGHQATDHQDLVRHVINDCWKEAEYLGSNKLLCRRDRNMRLKSVRCWCGAWFSNPLRSPGKKSKMASHLEKRSIEQHVLDIHFPPSLAQVAIERAKYLLWKAAAQAKHAASKKAVDDGLGDWSDLEDMELP